MKIFKDKEGKELTFKEFMKRWGEGIEGLTPAEKLNSQLVGTRIILIGIALGLFVSLYGYRNMWWVAIILTGAFINTWVQYISLRQQKRIFEKIEKQLNETEDDFKEIIKENIKENPKDFEEDSNEMIKEIREKNSNSGNKTCCATEVKGGKKK